MPLTLETADRIGGGVSGTEENMPSSKGEIPSQSQPTITGEYLDTSFVNSADFSRKAEFRYLCKISGFKNIGNDPNIFFFKFF